ncbi:hypothetical protein GOODEAATRI_012496 [Goodea atripinnis]|uniref:Uncharacterized protein n=1 Tax=Goodea atripinnis TaxID=208336 RepID=A0ABV0MHL1_9TELE
MYSLSTVFLDRLAASKAFFLHLSFTFNLIDFEVLIIFYNSQPNMHTNFPQFIIQLCKGAKGIQLQHFYFHALVLNVFKERDSRNESSFSLALRLKCGSSKFNS